MPLVYFDASAFVKLLTTETGSSLASALWDGCDAALSSRLAYPEVRAALAAAARNHDLTESELADAERDWEDFWAATRPVELTATVEQHAGHLARAHALRGADAVHLARRIGSRRPRPGSRRLGPTPAHRSPCRRVPSRPRPTRPVIRPLDVSHIGFGDRRPRASAADGSASVVQLPKRGDVKSAEEIMEILEAYDLTGSLRDARSWWGACITRSRVCGRAGARCELVE